jgi:hypothetical protein
MQHAILFYDGKVVVWWFWCREIFLIRRYCRAMIQDVPCCDKVFRDSLISRQSLLVTGVLEGSLLQQGVRRCLMLRSGAPKCFLLRSAVPRCFLLHQDALSCSKMFPVASRCYELQPDDSSSLRWSRLFWVALSCCEVSLVALRCSKIQPWGVESHHFTYKLLSIVVPVLRSSTHQWVATTLTCCWTCAFMLCNRSLVLSPLFTLVHILSFSSSLSYTSSSSSVLFYLKLSCYDLY